MILRVVRNEAETPTDAMDAAATPLPGFTPQLSLLVATVLALVAVAALVFFLHHIPASIRINTVLHGIGSRLIRGIEQRFPEDADPAEPSDPISGEPVRATKTGFIKIIDFASLDEIAEREKAVIALRVRTGDFVHPDVPLLEIKDAEPDDELRDQLHLCFDTGSIRTAVQDLEFLFDELVEIALRALSPGINDPFTAITSMQWMGAATGQLAARDLNRGPEQQDYDRKRVQPLNDDFAHFLRRGFGGVRASAAASALAAVQFLECLANAATACRSEDRRDQIRAEGERLMEQARMDMHGPSLDTLEARYRDFAERLDAQAV